MKILDIISDESKLSKGHFAQDASKKYCHVDNPDAVCWCLLGAISLINGSAEDEGYHRDKAILMKSIVELHPERFDPHDNTFEVISYFNDHYSYDEIREAVERSGL